MAGCSVLKGKRCVQMAIRTRKKLGNRLPHGKGKPMGLDWARRWWEAVNCTVGCLMAVRYRCLEFRRKVMVTCPQTGEPCIRSEGDTSEDRSASPELTPVCNFIFSSILNRTFQRFFFNEL